MILNRLRWTFEEEEEEEEDAVVVVVVAAVVVVVVSLSVVVVVVSVVVGDEALVAQMHRLIARIRSASCPVFMVCSVMPLLG